ncbi:DUF4956 domain-containing protein [Propionibacterium freudenreichii]|uniref:DUF4956 domain-containing protein n=1 Tax=Propionibacterium freudenreichii TaxID=1744 RepID=UPI0024346419|nr:DUF4956 domain-containing protein [Propionibacterium freudenreichii]WFF31758.1 DUF4956 domain-containing protein [Propionibacterium freudenreichii]
MTDLVALGADALMIVILTFAVYLPRHHRRDMVVASLSVNVGVLAVSTALSVSSVAAGLGLGLFGVLSIIRLRSEELSQIETAYYFSALALGLLGGVDVPLGYSVPLMALIVAVTCISDSRWIGRGMQRQVVALDRAYPDAAQLRAALGERLGGRILSVSVQRLDFVNDTTLVEVRFRPGSRAGGAPDIAVDGRAPVPCAEREVPGAREAVA